jgi:hypothetical protein
MSRLDTVLPGNGYDRRALKSLLPRNVVVKSVFTLSQTARQYPPSSTGPSRGSA